MVINNSVFILEPNRKRRQVSTYACPPVIHWTRSDGESRGFLGGTKINLVVIARLRFLFALFHLSFIIAGKSTRRISSTVRIALGFLSKQRTRAVRNKGGEKLMDRLDNSPIF